MTKEAESKSVLMDEIHRHLVRATKLEGRFDPLVTVLDNVRVAMMIGAMSGSMEIEPEDAGHLSHTLLVSRDIVVNYTKVFDVLMELAITISLLVEHDKVVDEEGVKAAAFALAKVRALQKQVKADMEKTVDWTAVASPEKEKKLKLVKPPPSPRRSEEGESD